MTTVSHGKPYAGNPHVRFEEGDSASAEPRRKYLLHKTLYIERSIGECRDGKWVDALDTDGVRRIVVGTGPGSFAGIRSALAFAQGFAIGTKCEVLGLPSPCALAADYFAGALAQSNTRTIEHSNISPLPLAVVGDARQGKYWIALFEGYRLVCDIFQVDRETLPYRVPQGVKVTTPDAKRIDSLLKEVFGENYIGGGTPTAEGLRRFAEANPEILKSEPLPIYLNPAVRT